MKNKVYLAGPIATEGDVMFMSKLEEDIRSLGFDVHAPHEDKSINDKSNNPKASDIFGNDGSAIDQADIIVAVESGREQVGTHTEIGKVIERIKLIRQGVLEVQDEPDLIVFTSNFRLNEPQIEDGLPSASINHYLYGGIKEYGTWVNGMSEGLLTYLENSYVDKKNDVSIEVGDIVMVVDGGSCMSDFGVGDYAVVVKDHSNIDDVHLLGSPQTILLNTEKSTFEFRSTNWVSPEKVELVVNEEWVPIDLFLLSKKIKEGIC